MQIYNKYIWYLPYEYIISQFEFFFNEIVQKIINLKNKFQQCLPQLNRFFFLYKNLVIKSDKGSSLISKLQRDRLNFLCYKSFKQIKELFTYFDRCINCQLLIQVFNQRDHKRYEDKRKKGKFKKSKIKQVCCEKLNSSSIVQSKDFEFLLQLIQQESIRMDQLREMCKKIEKKGILSRVVIINERAWQSILSQLNNILVRLYLFVEKLTQIRPKKANEETIKDYLIDATPESTRSFLKILMKILDNYNKEQMQM